MPLIAEYTRNNAANWIKLNLLKAKLIVSTNPNGANITIHPKMFNRAPVSLTEIRY